jgi:HD-GYP domain-containing protein (c-di-GMP phosphodiesterase class II)
MESVARPEFLLPIAQVKAGMELSRNVILRGATLLRYSTILDDELIDRLKGLGIQVLHVHLSDSDFQSFKQILLAQDTPPPYESAMRGISEAFLLGIPPQARPISCGATPEIVGRVEEVVRHTVDLIFGSRQLFGLLREADFFMAPLLRHSVRAWIFSLCVGVRLNYSLPALIDLSLASLFYDIGMTKIPHNILYKPAKLTDQEYSTIKKHTYFGRNMLEGVERFSPRAPTVAFEHHENYYGGGYPANKRGDAVHEFSQIVSITDKFAALITDKAHRDKRDPSDAVEMLIGFTRTSVSPKIFVAFMRSVLVYPRNSLLKLSTGDVGTPVEYPPHKPYRPVLRIIFDKSGNEIMHSRRSIDLSANPGISVVSYSVPEELPLPPPR